MIKVEEFSNMSILVVDDDHFTSKTHGDIAATLGVGNVVVTGNGSEAINEIEKGDIRFDAILLDIIMPEYDGVEFIRHLSVENIDIPIIIETGAPNDIVHIVESLGKAFSAPVQAIVRKPLSPSVLKALLEELD